jgi:putative DNA primase/helicase
MNRAPLTVEEQQRRAAALHQHALATQPSSTAPKNTASDDLQSETAALSPIEQWQIELAREAHEGRGIDALNRILLNVKSQITGSDADLLAAVDKIRDCAERHLVQHEPETVDAIFRAAFPSLNGSLDAIAINIDTDKEIQRLASLPVVQYERERTNAAAQLGMRTSVLDAAVKAARPTEAKGQGRVFELPSIEPWHDTVNGAELLDAISEAIGTYVIMSPESKSALALWAMHTHCFRCFEHTPRAAAISPEKGCAKTLTLDLLSHLVSRPLSTANATAAVIFRIVEMSSPTILIDEADTFLNENMELRGILNSGHRRGGTVMRTIGDDHEPRQFSTWAPAAIAMIGRLPDTLNDRSIVINLRRRKPTERVQSFRSDRAEHLKILARKMARWAQDHGKELVGADPDMKGLENRTADNWRPLFAIADAAGGRWSEHARTIANAIVQATVDQSISAQLFADIRWVFDGCPGAEDATAAVDRLPSASLVERLVKIEGRPWAEWKGGKPITQNTLARHLGRFGIVSSTVRFNSGHTAKGYYRSAFDDAFDRYTPAQSVTPSQPNNHGHCDGLQSVTPEKPVTLLKASQPNNHGHCDVVTVSNPRREAIEL